MPPLRIDVDATQLVRSADQLRAAGKNANVALAWGINAVGRKAATQMRRVLTKQTGLKYGVFVRALRTKAATASLLQFRITSRGGDVRLKFFAPHETRAGTSAAPWNKRTVHGGAFMKGGRFPNRVPLKMGKGVFKRVGRSRHPVVSDRSGLFIPDEMLIGASRAAFEKVTSIDLSDAATRALYAILSGAKVSARNFR